MITIRQHEIFYSNQTNLKEASKDDAVNTNIVYMTELLDEVVDFDLVKRKYLNNLHLSEDKANSVDAILESQGHIYFIEFKNGNMKNEKRKVKDKILHSLLLVSDILQKSIEYTRQNAYFILVYNESKNNKSLHSIASHVTQKAQETYIKFGLDIFEKLYFKSVYTLTEAEFDAFILNLNKRQEKTAN